jgi:L,D-transpeptidase catalytic domain
MRCLCCVLAALGFIVLAASEPAAASIVVHVDRASQRMEVIVDGEPRYSWRVSTARRGYVTPPGTYHPQRLAVRWYSRKYDNAPMPHSIFFAGGYAIHGTYEISGLGRPVSHGCVRLDPGNAATPVWPGRAPRQRQYHDRGALSRSSPEASPADLGTLAAIDLSALGVSREKHHKFLLDDDHAFGDWSRYLPRNPGFI